MSPNRVFMALVPLALAACASADPPPVLGADVCAPAVERALAPYGLSLAAMAEPQWFIDRYADADVPEDMQQPISGYRFRGRPPQCAAGAVAVAMWETCAVNEVRSVGGCHVDGLFHTWF